jgi:hypothetical protein
VIRLGVVAALLAGCQAEPSFRFVCKSERCDRVRGTTGLKYVWCYQTDYARKCFEQRQTCDEWRQQDPGRGVVLLVDRPRFDHCHLVNADDPP